VDFLTENKGAVPMAFLRPSRTSTFWTCFCRAEVANHFGFGLNPRFF
jgi:hypothetical protein